MMTRMEPFRKNPTARARTADVLVDALSRMGVQHVFGMPGSHSTTLYDAISRHDRLQTILVRNEQAGAFAADGYARVTGRPGVVCTTAGPGATNALTGIAEAWADSVPLLLLAGQVNADRLGVECGAYHEIDLESLFRPVAKFCATIRSPDQLRDCVIQAHQALTTGRPRPMVLILPQDVMRAEGTFEDCGDLPPPARPQAPDADAIRRAARLLAGSERPIILAGGGALWSGAAEAVRALAVRLGAPVVTSLNGKGLLDERDPISLGHARSARAKVALPHADAMLAIGCRFTEVMTDWRRMPVPARLVQIDLDAGQIGVNHPVAVGIQADARAALEALLPLVPARDAVAWGAIRDQARAVRPSNSEWLIEILRAAVPDHTIVFTDACELGYRMHTDWTSYGPRGFFYPSNYITLGWAFPAALGAAVALGGETPVVSVSGDGGFVMTAQEMATAVRYALKVIAIVHNDSTYGAIKNIQQRDHGGRFRDVDLNNPDFLKLAEAYGLPAARAADPESFRKAVGEAIGRDGPSLIEVPDRWRKIRA
jgi:thiamine pyrophosphate-dependent acetolactate synthase large subunit-like protein